MRIQKNTPTGNLLIVDDDSCVVNSLARLFRPFCDRIFTATNGQDALCILAFAQVDVIVSDFLVPAMTGIELFRKAKNDSPHLTTIMLSGKTDISDILRAKYEGVVNAFIPKPWDDNAIVTTICESLSCPRTLPGISWPQ